MSSVVISGDTSGAITVSAPAVAGTTTLTLPATTGTVIASDASANIQFNSGYGSVATAYGCRAWVNFNGTGTVAIRGSGNVTSITDNGRGYPPYPRGGARLLWTRLAWASSFEFLVARSAHCQQVPRVHLQSRVHLQWHNVMHLVAWCYPAPLAKWVVLPQLQAQPRPAAAITQSPATYF